MTKKELAEDIEGLLEFFHDQCMEMKFTDRELELIKTFPIVGESYVNLIKTMQYRQEYVLMTMYEVWLFNSLCWMKIQHHNEDWDEEGISHDEWWNFSERLGLETSFQTFEKRDKQ